MAEPAHGGARAELARLILGFVFSHACMTGMRLAAPLLALSRGYSEAAVGFMLALFSLTQVFLSLPAGRYVDRHGLRRPLGLALSVSALGVLCALAHPWLPLYPALCLAALCTGGAAGMVNISLQRHVGRAVHSPT